MSAKRRTSRASTNLRMRRWRVVYGVCAAAVLASLVAITSLVLQFEQADRIARHEMRKQQDLRIALYRMDSWLTPLLSREAARPYYEYQAFLPQQRAYTSLLYQIQPGDVLTPSPLLSFESAYFRLHFQFMTDGNLTSPQAPSGNLLELAQNDLLLAPQQIKGNAMLLQQLDNRVTTQQVMSCVIEFSGQQEPALISLADEPVDSSQVDDELAGDADLNKRMQQRSAREWANRAKTYASGMREAQQAAQSEVQNIQPQTMAGADRPGVQSQEFKQKLEAGTATPPDAAADIVLQAGPDDPGVIEVGSFVPLWISDVTSSDRMDLVFIRRVRVGADELYQGFLADWTALSGALREQIADLFPAAALEPVPAVEIEDAARGSMMATIPVQLQPNLNGTTPAVAGITPTRFALLMSWVTVLGGLALGAWALQASISFGRKRSRFASAVTHELRTPLTTFRMYTEMLADDMITDAQQRKAYLDTLHHESGRLSALVENVLSYAQLEEGRRTSHMQTMSAEDLLSALSPALQQRARGADIELVSEFDVDPEITLRTDPDAVGQIMSNLVDNACKYGCTVQRKIAIHAHAKSGMLILDVCDHGPGVSAARVNEIFTPFERGDHRDDAEPGIGLGLALSRELARTLGGDLRLNTAYTDGACFEITLPISPVRPDKTA